MMAALHCYVKDAYSALRGNEADTEKKQYWEMEMELAWFLMTYVEYHVLCPSALQSHKSIRSSPCFYWNWFDLDVMAAMSPV